MYLPAEFDYTEHKTRGSGYCIIAPGTIAILGLSCYRVEYRNEILPVLGFRLTF